MDDNLQTQSFAGLVPDAPLELKFAPSPTSAGLISGYASTFGGPADSHGDVIAVGAFTKSLARHKVEGTAPAMLWVHNPGEIIGTWNELKEDRSGLFVQGQINQQVERGREAIALLQAGAVRSLSIGYYNTTRKMIGGQKTITETTLGEISLLATPSNTRAKITGLKANSRREFEDFLRESGFSRSHAVTLAGRGWQGTQENDDVKEIADWLENARLELEGK